ncbi:SID-1 RNA chan domain containing protein, partial [Asbolus verrucosus]
MEFPVDDKTEQILVFPTSSCVSPYTIKTWIAEDFLNYSVLVMVQQEQDVLSWSLPLAVDASDNISLYFYNTSRTLCYRHMTKILRSRTAVSQNFIVALYTFSPVAVNISVMIEKELNFYLNIGYNYSIVTSLSKPKYFFYDFTKDIASVIIKISSDDVCLTRQDYPDGFFLVFVAKADDYDCIQQLLFPDSSDFDNRTSTLNFTLTKGVDNQDYLEAFSIILGAFGGFLVLALLMQHLFTKCNGDEVINEQNVLIDNVNERDLQQLLSRDELTVRDLSKRSEETRKKSCNYVWHIWNITVFYSIPVVQLVTTYQKVMYKTGNDDICYYNFLCANPGWSLSDVNPVFSYIGYVFMGFLFLAMVFFRHISNPYRATGIPVHYGVFYTMGFALIIEDTSFMYVMAVLCIVKLYQNRHSDINVSAYNTFTILGSTILFVKICSFVLAMLGILDGKAHASILWTIVALIYVALSIYLSLKIYFISVRLEGLKKFWENFRRDGVNRELFQPLKK